MRNHTSFIGLVAIVAMVASFAPITPVTVQADAWNSDLGCYPSYQAVRSGDWVTFTANYESWNDYGHSYSQPTWDAPDGSPSWGYGTTFGTRYDTDWDETFTVTVTNGHDWAECEVKVYGDDDDDWSHEDLSLDPMYETIDSGDSIEFTAEGGDGWYSWSTSEAGDSHQHGASTYTVRFFNYSSTTQTRYVTVWSDGETETATVRIRPDDRYDEDLEISPSRETVDNGDYVTFHATGGTGYYSWESEYGYGGSGDWFTVLFENCSDNWETQYVTVRSGDESEQARITVRGDDCYEPYPTPYPTWTPYPTPYPTWTPNPVVYPAVDLKVTQTARNVSDGQSGHYSSVRADGTDTLQFTIAIENTSKETKYNVRLTDILPSGLRYIDGSTTIDGEVVRNGVTASGLNLGTMVPNRVIAIRFSASVQEGSVPSQGSVIVYNTAHVRADNADLSVTQLPVTLGSGPSISTASGVETGTGDSIALAAFAGIVATLFYGLYTRSDLFNRRYAMAQIKSHMRDRQRLNFARLIS